MIFIDEARISVNAGDGGQGCESFYRSKHMRHPKPDGGDGGKGGDVIVVADRMMQTLLDYKFKQHYRAQNGGHGSSKRKKGKDGQDYSLHVPLGTLVKDDDSSLVMRDLTLDRQSVIVVKGGQGGQGNAHQQTSTPLQKGEQRNLRLELKLIADVGIIGFPNAGKSTLVSNISKVQSKIANYPFTTKKPVLGTVRDKDFNFIVADLPGIIEGAHKGKGLGDRFLKHAERTKILVHVIDMAATENRDPLEDFALLNHELSQYDEAFMHKKKIVVANKMDLPQAQEHLKRFKSKYREAILTMSALEKKGFQQLIKKIREVLCQENSLDP